VLYAVSHLLASSVTFGEEGEELCEVCVECFINWALHMLTA
jgi:hypothetical protein